MDYIMGRGEYSDQRSFRPGEEDKQEQESILKKMAPKCPSCVSEIHDYLESGAMREEIDKDPNLEVQEWEESRESYREDVDEVTDRYFVAYCSDHDDESYFSFQITFQ